MSENLDLVRSIYAAWERGDFSAAEWADPDIELVYTDGPDPGRRRGPAAMAKDMRRRLSALEGVRFEAEEYREIDDKRVLVFYSMSGRGQTSGLELGEMAVKAAALFHVRGGKVTRIVSYFEREHLPADLGLKE
jgi:ketosteroid isomerase-like protein